MCLSCGCLSPNDDHNDPRHITLDMLEAAAEANNSTVYDVLKNIEDGYYLNFQQIMEHEMRPKKKIEAKEES